MSKRPPAPLAGSPLWQPLNVAFRPWWKRLQDPSFALVEFRRALREGQLVALRREEGKAPRVLAADYWQRARLAFDREEPLTVIVVEGDGPPSRARFFFWEPAEKTINRESAPPSSPKSGSAAVWIDEVCPNEEWRLMTAKQVHQAIEREAKRRKLNKWPSYSSVRTVLKERRLPLDAAQKTQKSQLR